MYNVCIFDLDGTLTDTLESLTVSVNKTLCEMGLSMITAQQCRVFVGNGARALLQRALEVSGDEKAERIEEAMRIYRRIFDEFCTYHVVPYEGIREMLSELKEAQVRMGVLSNKPHRQTVSVVESIFGRDVFELIQGQKDGIPRKPDPAAVLDMIKELGSVPEQSVYIGDSEVDVATGLAARMQTIGVTWGFRSQKILEEAGAEKTVDHPQEIVKLIKE
ncbi:MAG: HAD family hydrolase [Schaedlerella sp.]|nr:HAD family hydrolase [Schaedlerella sp.]